MKQNYATRASASSICSWLFPESACRASAARFSGQDVSWSSGSAGLANESLWTSTLLPGPNVLNLTVIVGHRFAGWTGAAAGVAGFLGWPCLMVVGMGVLYQHYGALPYVQQALTGMSSVAAGLLLATVIKLATVLPRHWRPWLFGVLAFVAVGIMRWPLLWVMGALAPWAVFAAWKEPE
jgi:chromate transporter